LSIQSREESTHWADRNHFLHIRPGADRKNDWFYRNPHQGQLRGVSLAPESRDRVVFEEVINNGCNLKIAVGPDRALYYSDPKGIYHLHGLNATNLLQVVTTTTGEQASLPAQDGTATAGAMPAQDGTATAGAMPAPTEQTLAAGTRPEDWDVKVSLTEWKLPPSRTKVPSGQIRFLAENTGTTQHALRILGQGIDISTGTFGPWESRSLTIVLPPGKYQLCPVPGHEQQGMTATLEVVGS
jgi:uncharacterized cupredoxin-like copper-binding protein